MPWSEVMHKWKTGKLHSGGPRGKTVTSRKQAIAILLSEKRKAASGAKPEYTASTEDAISALKHRAFGKKRS